MDPATVVRALWEAMDARDWDRVASLLAPDADVAWPQSGERLRGAANFVAVNRAYPGAWRLEVERVVAQGAQVVAQVRIPFPDRVEWAVGFYEVAGGKILRATEYWCEAFAPQAWRAAWVEGPAARGP